MAIRSQAYAEATPGDKTRPPCRAPLRDWAPPPDRLRLTELVVKAG